MCSKRKAYLGYEYIEKYMKPRLALLTILVVTKNMFPCQPRKPLLAYDHYTKQLTAIHIQEDDKKICKTPTNHAVFHHVNHYQLNSQNNYLSVNMDQQDQPQESMAISVLKKIAPQMSNALDTVQKILPNSSGNHFVTKIIDARSFTEVLSLPEDCITHVFSPNGKKVILALPAKKEPSTDRYGAQGTRIPTPDGKVLCYHLYDIQNKKLLKTLENIQALIFDSDDTLLAKYDNEKWESINIAQNAQPSIWETIWNTITYQATIKTIADETTLQSIPIINYNLSSQKLTIIIPNRSPKHYSNITSYILSPQRLYVMMHRTPQSLMELWNNAQASVATLASITTIICLKTGTEMFVGNNGPIVTNEFNQEETMLLLLIAPVQNTIASLYSSNPPRYHAFDLQTGVLSKPLDNCQAAYFSPTNKIIYFDNDDAKQEWPLAQQKKSDLSLKEDEDENSQYEDLEILMETFSDNQNKEHIEKIKADIEISEASDVEKFLAQYSRYNFATKKSFSSLFFCAPQENTPNKPAPNTVCIKGRNGQMYQFSLDAHTHQIKTLCTPSKAATASLNNQNKSLSIPSMVEIKQQNDTITMTKKFLRLFGIDIDLLRQKKESVVQLSQIAIGIAMISALVAYFITETGMTA